MEKQIEELRSALKDADMDDEQREAATATLNDLETSLQEAKAARESEIAAAAASEESEEETEESRSVDSGVAEAMQAVVEVSRVLAEGQTELLDELKAMRSEASEARAAEEEWEEEVEKELESRSTDDDTVAAIAELKKLVEETIPLRRGAGPSKEEDRSESDRVEAALAKIVDPGDRLRAAMKHSTGERLLDL